jgi:ElaB/YqjD/DUF883 family membrane-anchored ribosome-binding protein
MRKVTVVTTNNSQVNQFEVEAGVSTFSQLVAALPAVDFSNKTVTVGKALYSLEHADAILPEGALKVFISPKDMKAAMAEYHEVRAALKQYRLDAVTNDDEEILEIIGNYTHDTLSEMKDKLDEVLQTLLDRVETTNDVCCNTVKARLFEVEYALGIRNSDNAARFNERVLAEAKYATQK